MKKLAAQKVLHFVFVIFAICFVQNTHGQVVYVNHAATGANNGTSWASAFTDLQDALDSNMSGTVDTILIAEGTYYPTQSPDGSTTNARDRAFHLANNNVVILGGYNASTGSQTGGSTILSGDLVTAGTASDSAYHVFITTGLSSATVISKLTITAAKANGSSSSPINYAFYIFFPYVGGGMYNISSSPTLTNCVFTGNSATQGGGMYNFLSSSPTTLTNCVFTGNSATQGGGMYNASSSPTLTNCAFAGNSARTGGGMYNYSSSPTLINTLFFKNTATTGKSISNIAGSSLNSSTHNASDADLSLFPNTKIDLSGKYYKDLFVDSTDLDGTDDVWGTADDGLFLLPNSILRDSGTATGAPALDIAGNTRPTPPSIGAYEYSPCVFAASVVYVDIAATGNETGTSWGNAFTDLQDALDARMACSIVDTILIAEGTYYPTQSPVTSTNARDKAFHLANANVVILGGYDASTGTQTGGSTILSGDIGTVGSTADNCYHVFITTGLSSATVISKLTITAGKANGSSSSITYGSKNFFRNWCGGMYNYSSSPTLTNCVFTGNSASSGGGMYNTFSSLTLTNCVFIGNSATNGGGMRNILSSPTLTNCVFASNSADNDCGGMRNSNSSPTLTNTLFYKNTATSNKSISNFSSSLNSNSTHNASDADLSVFPNTKIDLSGKYYKDLFVDSTDLDGTDDIWGTADDGLLLLPNSILRDAGTAAGAPALDLAGNTRPTPPSIGAYEYSPCVFAASVVYVDIAATGNETGTSWANAFTDLQDALDARMACSIVDTILIAEGTYYPTQSPDGSTTNARDRAFHLANANVVILGGYDASTGTQTGGSTILSGDIGTVGSTTDNCYHVFITTGLSSATVISKLTIAAAKANGSSSITYASNIFFRSQGGGMNNYSSSPTLTNCVFASNSADFGGGMYNSSSSPTMVNVTLASNTASIRGGGMYNSSSSPSVTNSIFWNNMKATSTTADGADIENNSSSSPIVTYTSLQSYAGSTGCLIGDPLFVDATNGNYRLKPCSPAINIGTPDTTGLNLGLVDLAENPRVFDGRIDLGAFESQGYVYTTAIFVDADATGNNDGSSWGNAYTDLQDAIDNQCGGLDIWVAAGTYHPTVNYAGSSPTNGKEKVFFITKNLRIYGGFAGTETSLSERNWEINKTILSGDFNNDDTPPLSTSPLIIGNTTENAYHVIVNVNLTADAIFDGLTVKGGNANGSSGFLYQFIPISQENGGGMQNVNSSPTLRNITFEQNSAENGGGIYNRSGSNPEMNNLTFRDNVAFSGAGIYDNGNNPTIKNSTFENNISQNGGGIYSTSLEIINSIFLKNSALGNGGGIYFTNADAKISNSTFVENTASADGGGLYSITSTPIVTNTVFWNNTKNGDNNIAGADILATSNNVTATNSLTQVYNTGTDNIINQDPVFVDAANGDLRLQSCSPAINAGTADTTGLNLGLVDFDDNPRVFGGVIDIGAYESNEVGSQSLVSSVNPSIFGQSVTFTSTMSPSDAVGSIAIKEGTTVLSTQTLSGGEASFSKSDLIVGSHTITAHYSGSCPNLAPISNYVLQVVQKGVAELDLASSKNPSTYGENITFTANVTPADATGTIVFKEAGLPIGSTSLSGTGVATLSIATLSAGNHPITAEYSGDVTYHPATSLLLNQQVNKATSSLSLVSDLSSAAFGASITFTATLAEATATGSIVFKEGATTLGTIGINSSGKAVLVLNSLAVGNHAITAEYAGDSNFTGSSSSVVNVSVGLASTSLTLAGVSTSVYGTSVDFTASITPNTATGNIIFKEGSTTLGTVALSAGSATLSLASLTAGSHSIIAEYEGDISYSTSSSSPLLHTVTCPALLPAITFTGTDLLNCAGGTVNRTANGAASYVWSNGLGNNATANISIAATYTVTATFTSGCTTTATVAVAEPIQPTLTAGLVTNPSTCGGTGKIAFSTTNIPDGNYYLSFTGIGSPKNVSVSANSFELTGLVSGAYSNFSMDVAGCNTFSSQSKALNDPSAPTLLAGTLSHPTVCEGTGSIAFSSTNLPDGTYSLSFTGIGSPKSISVASNAFTLANLTAGTYSNFNITHLGCTGSDASSVTINDPDSPTLLPGLVTEPAICGADGSLAFTSTNLPDGTYWLSFTGAGSPKDIVVSSNAFDLTGLKAGTYSQFSITNAGCTGVFAGSKTLTNPPAATLTAGAISHPTTCAGSDGAIAFNSALGDGSYTLNYVGAGSPKVINISGNAFNINGLSAGNYSNFSITIPGCISSDVVTKTLQDPVILATASNTGPYNESQKIDLNATGGDSYTWTGPNGFFSTLQNPSLVSATPANAGIYSVTVTAANNCSATASTQVSVNCSSQSLNYYLVFADGNPQIISPLVSNLQVQASSRPMSVIAVSACETPSIESVKLQLSGTSNLQYQIDNEMPFNLHDFYNVNVGDVLAPNFYTFIARGYDQDNANGNVITGPDVIRFNILKKGRSITLPTSSVSQVCVGNTFNISAMAENNAAYPFGTGNLYQVYLSDTNGDFMTRTLIGAGNDPSNISCQIPMYLKGSSKYKLMVVSTNPIVASEPSLINLNVIGSDLSLKSPSDDYVTENYSDKAIGVIKANNDILNSSEGSFQAGKHIELNPGFEVSGGSVFEAKIKNPCPL